VRIILWQSGLLFNIYEAMNVNTDIVLAAPTAIALVRANLCLWNALAVSESILKE